MRIACFYVPLFPLAARLRSEPELATETVAIVEGNGSRAFIAAASKRARVLGVRAGMTLPQGRAIVPGLIARGRDADCEKAAQEALLDVAARLSPRVEDGAAGVAYMEISGLERHYAGSDHPERALASSALHEAEREGLRARVGIAASKLAARIAAELPESPTIVEPGDEMKFLAPLPIERLDPGLEIGRTLDRWGIRSIGELANLSEAEVATRLGETGRQLHCSARGFDPTPIIPRVPPPEFSEGMDLEWPLVALEPFLFVANAALDRLCRRMESLGFSCRILEVSLRLEPDGFHDRTIRLPTPTREVKTLLTFVRLELEATPPGAPVTGFLFTAHPDRPRTAQMSLFGPPAMSPDRIATTIARLSSMVSRERVGSPRTVDSRSPERFNLVAFDPPPPPMNRRDPAPHRGLLTVRTIRPPVELEVILELDTSRETRPVRLRPLDSKESRIEGAVRVASGPWRLEEGWWSDHPVERSYWDVELARGGLYRIYYDSTKEKWFADGMYD
ncbi:MAG: DNA polymerase Y family protein [Acidobacteria bacterium]|nr:DNA polymerase Y family protein [Acidobacteriota bacterium]